MNRKVEEEKYDAPLSLRLLSVSCLANICRTICNYLYLIKLSQASYDLGQTASYKRPELNSSLMIQLVSLKGLKAPITAVHKRNGGFGRIHVVAIFREAPGQLSQQQATQRVAVSKVCFLVTTKRVEANP